MSERRGQEQRLEALIEEEPLPDEEEPLPDEEELLPDEEEPERPAAQESGQTEQEQPARGRGASREARLNARLREAEAARERERQEYQRTLAQLAQRPQPPDPMQTQREAERLALMSPQEIAAYYQDQTERRVGQALAQHQFQTADLLDRQSYEQLCRDSPVAQRLRQKVEDTLAQERQEGRNPSRGIILRALYGDEMLARTAQATVRQGREGRRRIEQQRTQPSQGRSGAAAPARGQDDIEAVRARLRGVPL